MQNNSTYGARNGEANQKPMSCNYSYIAIYIYIYIYDQKFDIS